MNVKQLMEKLSTFDDDVKVFVPRHNSKLTYGFLVESIEEITNDDGTKELWIE